MVRASSGGFGSPRKLRPQQLNPISPEVCGPVGLRPDGDRAGGLEEQPPAPHGAVFGGQALTIVNLMTLIPRKAFGFLVYYRDGHLRHLLPNAELVSPLPCEMRV